MCVKCGNNNCACQPDYENAQINLTRQYILSTEGPQGPPGEVPPPILSNELFDI